MMCVATAVFFELCNILILLVARFAIEGPQCRLYFDFDCFSLGNERLSVCSLFLSLFALPFGIKFSTAGNSRLNNAKVLGSLSDARAVVLYSEGNGVRPTLSRESQTRPFCPAHLLE